MDQKSNKSWIGAVFGLVFLVSGCAAGYAMAGKMIIGYLASSSWVEVPATIHELELVRNYGETTTYSVKSDYSYYFNGVRYDNDRVSVSGASDNIGKYFQNLERALRKSQLSNEASAIVNPDDPTESLLDRTLRWKSIVFGSIFLMSFGGAGGFITWASLRGRQCRKARLQQEQEDGISSDQKTGSWLLAALGGVFFVFGGGLSLVALPDAIRDGRYGALFILVFVLIGAGIIAYAVRMYLGYQRFGPTPLLLDPSVPGVGGQLGGQFSITVPSLGQSIGSAPQLRARLTCTHSSKSGKSTNYRVKWQEEAPVYLKETSQGVDASFLFEIPEDCTPSKEWHRGSSIDWAVTVEGEFSAFGLGKFERSWEVVVEDSAAQASDVSRIPQGFMKKATQQSDDRVKTAALEQIPIVEDTHYITVHSKAGRGVGAKGIGIVVGAVFAGTGLFVVMQSGWPGYFFLLLGSAIFSLSVYTLGKSIKVVVDKYSRVLYTQET